MTDRSYTSQQAPGPVEARSSMFDGSPLAVAVTCGEAHEIRYANPSLCRLAGAPPESLVGRSLATILPRTHGESIVAVLKRVHESGQPAHCVGIGESAGTDGGPPTYTVWPFLEGGRIAGLVVQVGAPPMGEPLDGTQSDLLNANQRLLLAGLDADQRARAAENELTLQQELERHKENLLNDIAHDLKTPLTTVKGFTQLLLRLLDRGQILEPERTREELGQIDATVRRIVAQIDELLARRQPQLDRAIPLLDLGALVTRVVSQHQETRETTRIVLRAGPETLLGNWDAAELERVVWNLLSNAIKYSTDGSEVEVYLGVDDATIGLQAVLEVRDHGIGIPPDDLPYIYERHFRGGNVGQIEGSGIGLAGVREIVERYEGAVSTESTPNGGTTFAVRLPLGASPRHV